MFRTESSRGKLLSSPPLEKQQLAVPCGVAKALDELHATVSLQVLLGMLCHVPTDLQSLEVVKV